MRAADQDTRRFTGTMAGIIVLLVHLTNPGTTNAQGFTTGELVPEDFERSTTFTSPTELPLQFAKSVDLRRQLPPAQDQGTLGVCWAFAGTYALISHLENTGKADDFFLNLDGSADLAKLCSPELPIQLIYRGNPFCGAGANSARMLDSVLQRYGSVPMNVLQYSGVCDRYPSEAIIQTSKQRKRVDYEVIVDDNPTKAKMKTLLMTGQPFLISTKIDRSFKGLPTTADPYGPLWKTQAAEEPFERHAMVVVGYVDSIDAALVLNSWGQHWGNHGYAWIDFTRLIERTGYYCYPKMRPLLADVEKSTATEESNTKRTQITTYDIRSWVKDNYYRTIGDLTVGALKIYPHLSTAKMYVATNDGIVLWQGFIDVASTKEFTIHDRRYRLTLEDISSEGINILRKAANFYLECISCELEEVHWTGELELSSGQTINHVGKRLVLDNGAHVHITRDSQVGGSDTLKIIADEIIIAGTVRFSGIGRNGNDGANEGSPCEHCANNDLEWITNDHQQFQAAQDNIPNGDYGSKGDDGEDGGPGPKVLLRSILIDGLSRIDHSALIGGYGGLGARGGANRLYTYRRGTQMEHALGGNADSGKNGKPGPPGEVIWQPLRD